MSMSDTTAFLAGCAISGVAAVLLLRGGFALGGPPNAYSPTSPTTPPLPTMQVPMSSMPVMPNSGYDSPQSQREWQLTRELDQQHNLTEALRMQLDEQRTQTDELKRQTDELRTQVQRQQSDAEQLIRQLQEQQRMIDSMTTQVAMQQQQQDLQTRTRMFDPPIVMDQTPKFQTLTVVAIGATILVVIIGGGLFLLVIVVFLLQSQRKVPRTVHVIHPVTPPYLLPEQPLLPAQATRSPKRAKPIDVDYYGE